MPVALLSKQHMASKQRRINVNATSDVALTLIQRSLRLCACWDIS